MLPRERLRDLHAAPMPMQVAERAEIHQDVEDESVACLVLAEQVVVAAALAERQAKHLVFAGGAQAVYDALNLSIRSPLQIVPKQQRGHDLVQRVSGWRSKLDGG